MKKFFSLIALVGVLAACQKEDLKTAFTVEPGVATIHVQAFAIDGTDITDQVSFTFDGVSGSKDYVVPNTATTGVFKKKVVVSGTWTGFDGARSIPANNDVTVPVEVLPGGKFDAEGIKLYFGKASDLEYVYTTIDHIDYDEFKTEFKYLEQSHSHAATHAAKFLYHDGKEYDGIYLMNPSEFILYGTLDYKKITGTVANGEINWVSGVEPLQFFVDLCNEVLEEVSYTPDSLNFKVSGFAMYCAYHANYSSVGTVELYRQDKLGHEPEKIADFSYTEYWGNEAGVIEAACAGHEAHYVPGHGHDDSHGHGHGSNNAGGGIVYAD